MPALPVRAKHVPAVHSESPSTVPTTAAEFMSVPEVYSGAQPHSVSADVDSPATLSYVSRIDDVVLLASAGSAVLTGQRGRYRENGLITGEQLADEQANEVIASPLQPPNSARPAVTSAGVTLRWWALSV